MLQGVESFGRGKTGGSAKRSNERHSGLFRIATGGCAFNKVENNGLKSNKKVSSRSHEKGFNKGKFKTGISI